MKPARSLFLPSPNYQTFSSQQPGSVCSAGTVAQKGLLCSPAGSRVVTAVQTTPLPGNVAKSTMEGAAGKAICRSSRSCTESGLEAQCLWAALSPAPHWVLLVQKDLSPSLGTCVSCPGVKCWSLGKSMCGVAGEGEAQMYPQKSLTHLPQPNTRAFRLSQPLQQGAHTPRDTKRKVNSCDHAAGTHTNPVGTSVHKAAKVSPALPSPCLHHLFCP